MKNQPRVDPVIAELITGARGNEESISTSYIQALAHVLSNASQNVGDKARESCVELVVDVFREECSGVLLPIIFYLLFTFFPENITLRTPQARLPDGHSWRTTKV